MLHKTFITSILLLATSVVLASTQPMKLLKPNSSQYLGHHYSHIQNFYQRQVHNGSAQYNQTPRLHNCRLIEITCMSDTGRILERVSVQLYNVFVNSQYQCLPEGEPWDVFSTSSANTLCQMASGDCATKDCHFVGYS